MSNFFTCSRKPIILSHGKIIDQRGSKTVEGSGHTAGGKHVFCNKVLERSYNDHSYWADGAYHYNICDYLGNVRMPPIGSQRNA